MSLVSIGEVAAAAGVELAGAPGEVVRLEDCEAFLVEAARRELVVLSFRGVELLDGGAIEPRFDGEAFYSAMPAAELLSWGLLAGRAGAGGAGSRGVEFYLATAGQIEELAASADSAAPRRRAVDWGAAPTVLLLLAAVGLTALLLWSVTTAMTCGAA